MNYFLALFLIFLSPNIFAQNISCELLFTVTTKNDLFEKNIKDLISEFPDKEKIITETKKNSQDIFFNLSIEGNKAIYTKEKLLSNDGVNGPNIVDVYVSNELVFTDLDDNLKLVRKKLFPNYLVSIDDLEWTITKETKVILNFNCFKATTKVKSKLRDKEIITIYEVWFTPEVNLPFGPDIFSGLPGLVLEVMNTNQFIQYKATELKKLNKNIEICKPNGKLINQSEYDSLIIQTKKKYLGY